MKKLISVGKKYLAPFLVIVIINMVGCKDDLQDKVFTTSTGVTIAGYMKLSPDTFSEMYKILEKTNVIASLNAYGKYTFFAPNNAAVKEFIASVGKSSVDDFTTDADIALLKSVVKLHLVPDTISSSSFREGGLVNSSGQADTTMSGDMLVTEFGTGGINDVTLGKVAKIVKRDIQTVNGFIHVIDKVLLPSEYSVSLYDKIAGNSDYSIFAEALRATGLVDSIKASSYVDAYDVSHPYITTVFVEADSVYKKYRINNYTDLFNRFSNTKNPLHNPNDTLYMMMAGLCIKDVTPYFLRDFKSQNYLTLSTDYLTVSIEDTFTLNSYFVVDKYYSNNVAKNGVYHLMDSMFRILSVPAAPLYWDIFSTWTEITQHKNISGVIDIYQTKTISIPGTDFPSGLSTVRMKSGTTATYQYSNGDLYYKKDHFEVPDMKTMGWIEMDLPAVNMGTYNLWVCGKFSSSRVYVNVYLDGKWIGKYDQTSNITTNNLDYKVYMTGSSNYKGALIGTRTFTKTATHVIKFEYIANQNGKVLSLDMIHLIPITMDQKAVTFKN
jgi:uncharacterized surface protein with fasciclin (FAS1) repeats